MGPDAWLRVRSGLLWSYYGLCVVVAGFALTILLALGLFRLLPAGGGAALQGLALALIATALVGMLGRLLDLIGRIRCARLPRGFQGKTALGIAIAVQALAIGWDLMQFVGSQVSLPPRTLVVLVSSAPLLSYLSPLVLLAFVHGAAVELRRRDLAGAAARTQRWGLALLTIHVLSRIATALWPRLQPWAMILGGVLAVGGLLVFILFAHLIRDLASAIVRDLEAKANEVSDDLNRTWAAPDPEVIKKAVQGELEEPLD